MSAPCANRSKRIRRLLLSVSIPAAILAWCVPALVRVPGSDAQNYVLLAQEFLHASYPNLKDRHLFITIVRDYAFDLPAAPMREFSLYVCEGPKYKILGYMGGYPEGAKSPSPAAPGPVYPKQHLATGFKFDQNGRLLFFSAEGDAVGDLVAGASFREAREAHPEWAEAQVTSEFKRMGAKYGPDDKEQLIKDLPVELLERYLGKLTIESAAFEGADRGELPPGNWFVKIRAQDGQGHEMKYTLLIEPFKGSLLSITPDPTPSTNR
jgi:hypothetical protein